MDGLKVYILGEMAAFETILSHVESLQNWDLYQTVFGIVNFATKSIIVLSQFILWSILEEADQIIGLKMYTCGEGL